MQNNNVLYAIYEENTGRLKIESPLITRDLLDKVFLNKGLTPFTFCPENPEESWKGQISFSVRSKENYAELVDKFNTSLKEFGYTLESKI